MDIPKRQMKMRGQFGPDKRGQVHRIFHPYLITIGGYQQLATTGTTLQIYHRIEL